MPVVRWLSHMAGYCGFDSVVYSYFSRIVAILGLTCKRLSAAGMAGGAKLKFMAWPPSNHIQVFDERKIKDDFLIFFKANQVDALAWANGGAGLEPIKAFHKSARLTSVFPALTFLQSDHSQAFGNGGISVIVFNMTVELAVIHGKQDELTDRASKYDMALRSMLANAPDTTLSENSIIPITSTLQDIETVYDVQGKLKNRFIQISQTRVSWVIDAASENS